MAKTKYLPLWSIQNSQRIKCLIKYYVKKAIIKTYQSEAKWQSKQLQTLIPPPAPETLKNKQKLPEQVKKYYMKCP